MALVLIHHPEAERMVVVTHDDHLPMEALGDGWWQAPRPESPYRFGVIDADGGLHVEPRDRAPDGDAPVTVERWIVDTVPSRVRSSAVFHRAGTGRPVEGSLIFRLFEPWIPRGHRPVVVGSIPELGEWDPNDAVYLTAMEDGWWAAAVDVATTDTVAYKYVIVAPDGTLRWEPDTDRILPTGHRELTVVDHGIDGLGGWRGAGVSVPVSALRSRTSLGIGQFTDLLPFAQWASSVGLGMVQIQPVNDSIKYHDERDFAPHDPVSVNALHPVYLDLRELVGHHPAAADRLGPELDAVQARFSVEAEYGEVMDIKWELAAQCFDIMIDGDAEAVSAFVETEWEWLGSYAAWCVLRDAYGTPDPSQWGVDAVHDPRKVLAMADPSAGTHRSLAFHCWLQYHLHRQFATAVEFAEMAGVRLATDVPFGVSAHSVEAWASPEAFQPDRHVGAPPHDASQGRNRRFPAWSWDDAVPWWARRLERLATTADAYRLGGVLGFFRSWEIPDHADDARLGTFRPCLPLGADDLAAVGLTHEELTSPLIDDTVLTERFGTLADVVGSVCLIPDGDTLAPAFATQRGVRAAVAAGLLPEAVEGPLLELVADVLTIETDGGYHPRAAWQQVERWRRLNPSAQRAFDEIAVDFFDHRHTGVWRDHARAVLEPLLDATPMLATAEDPGVVPDFAAATLTDLGVLGLRVERMSTDGWIADPAESPYLSVVTTGTHDMPTIREWWATDRSQVERYWREVLGQEGDPPAEAGPGICSAIVDRHLLSPAMLCVIPLHDLLAVDPDTRSQHRERGWTSVEDLLMATELNERLRSLIAGSGR